jgi:uncharacterized protein (DUF1015 family)
LRRRLLPESQNALCSVSIGEATGQRRSLLHCAALGAGPPLTWVTTLADIRAFRGIRYNASRFGRDVSDLVCPPYDVISPDEQTALYARHPNNAVRLELTQSEPTDRSEAERYHRAAQWFSEWRSEQVLATEPNPALYAYLHEFTLNGASQQRRGVLAALRVEPWEKRVVRPHERTLSGPKRDRLELMRACRANLSPIWGLYGGAPDITARFWDRLEAQSCDAESVDRDGVVHRLWVITDPALVRGFRQRLTDSPVYIADGHHRYETAMHYEDETCESSACSEDAAVHFTLAYLVDVSDPGLTVLGTHRLIRSPRTLDAREVRSILEREFELQPRVGGAVSLLEALGIEGDRPAFGVWAPSLGMSVVARLRGAEVPEAAAPGRSAAWRRLDLAALHTLAVDRIYPEGTTALSESGHLRYARAAEEAERATSAGEVDMVFFVRHTSVHQVTAVADAGDLMPEKSTYFYPKPVTGLVIASLEGDIPVGV